MKRVLSCLLFIVCSVHCNHAPLSLIDSASLDPSDANTSAQEQTVSLLNLRPVDVSILWPRGDGFPSSEGRLSPWSIGQRGALIPESMLSMLDFGLKTRFGEDAIANLLRVSAVRFDPCAPLTANPTGPCRNEVRLSFQFGLTDTVLHAVYEVSREELLDALREILRLSEASGGYDETLLVPHPILAREGFVGAFGVGLNSLLLRLCGADSLRRVSALLRMPVLSTQWMFVAIDYENQVPKFATIPGVIEGSHSFAKGYEGPPEPTPNGNVMHDGSSTFAPIDWRHESALDTSLADMMAFSSFKAKTQAARLDLVNRAAAFENPYLTTFHHSDCISCHVAFIRHDLVRAGYAPAPDQSLVYQPHQRMAEQTGHYASDTISFGFLDPFFKPGLHYVITQRVLNETDYVLGTLYQLGDDVRD